MEKNYIFNKDRVFDILLNEPDRVFLETRDPQAAQPIRFTYIILIFKAQTVRGSLLQPRKRYEYGELDPMKNRIFLKNQNGQLIETSFHLCTLWRVIKLM